VSNVPIPFRLYAVTDRGRLGGRALDDALAALCGHGLRGVQLREKDLEEAELERLAALCRPVMDRFRVAWLVNGPSRLAARVGATGVHLAASGDVPSARAVVGPEALVGKSAHTAAEARDAAGAGADFVVVGPVFATPSKAPFGPPLGLDTLRAACTAAAPVPVFAIGGVTPERARACRDAGAHGVAAQSALMSAGASVAAADVLAQYAEALGGL
jgi:thiamine-phosphate pyrophosphorylase